ncbi:hypothetical protein D3C76_875960 [compost metagenome]
MMGKLTWVSWVSLMSSIHFTWEATGSTESARTFTPRLAKSSLSLAVRPSSVVQTGVKSAGWENSTPQLLPSQSWKRRRPVLDSCSKSGAMSPSLRLMKVTPCSWWAHYAQGFSALKRIDFDFLITKIKIRSPRNKRAFCIGGVFPCMTPEIRLQMLRNFHRSSNRPRRAKGTT